MDSHAQKGEPLTEAPAEATPPIKRKHICPSAGYWFDAAQHHWQKGNEAAVAYSCLENAYNHLENALAAGMHFTDQHLPPRKHGWEHSEQVLVFYEASLELQMVERFGIAYYHYSPPFDGPKWTDFSGASGGRTPSKWWYLPVAPIDPGTELLLELNAEDPKTALENFKSIKRRFALAQASAAKHHEGDRAACDRALTAEAAVAELRALLKRRTEFALETCVACGKDWSPSIVESGHCIFCIQKETKAKYEANYAVLALDNECWDALRTAFGMPNSLTSREVTAELVKMIDDFKTLKYFFDCNPNSLVHQCGREYGLNAPNEFKCHQCGKPLIPKARPSGKELLKAAMFTMSSTGTIAHGEAKWTSVDGEKVGIEVSTEPKDLSDLEHCFRCAMPTNFWYLPNNVACCPDCAMTLRASQVPTHEKWMADHRHLHNAHPKRPDDEYYHADGTCLCPACHKPYTEHPKVPGRAWLNQLCDGTRVKL